MNKLIVFLTVLATCSTVFGGIIVQSIDIGDFVTIGNAGNAADTTGYGSVNYTYQIGQYEITNGQWDAFVAIAGAPAGASVYPYDEGTQYAGYYVPTNNVSWYEIAQYCNFLTSGDKSKGAYLFDGNNANAGNFLGVDRNTAMSTYGTIYVIPNENEWYKAAYYKLDNSSYYTYANGGETLPLPDDGWNYWLGPNSYPWNVGTGTIEQNGTYDMMGNVAEWLENYSGTIGVMRGGNCFSHNAPELGKMGRISSMSGTSLDLEGGGGGFRIVAIIPEPATVALLCMGGLMLRKRKV